MQGAILGDDGAQNAVGLAYDSGAGVKKDKGKAIAWFKKAWRTNGQSMYCVNIALTYAEIGRQRSALYWWQKAIAMGDGSAALSLAKYLLESNPGKLSRRIFDLLKMAAASQEPLNISLADKEQAQNLLEELLSKDPFNLALAYLSLKQYDIALKYALVVRNKNPHAPNIHLNIGSIYEGLGDKKRAANSYKRELVLQPKSGEAWFNLGQLRYGQHQWKKASECFEQCIKLSYRQEKVLDFLVFCYEKLGEVDQEITLYRNLLKRDPHDWWAMMNLGAVLIDLGRFKESLKWSAKAKKLMPEEPIIDRNIDKARKLLKQELRTKRPPQGK